MMSLVALPPAASCGSWEHSAVARLVALAATGQRDEAAFLAARIKDAYGGEEKERANADRSD